MIRGARTGVWAKSGGGVPTARDYVQDGLVAMWDGIENAGWGKHDDSLGRCVNLLSPGSFDTPYTSFINGSDYADVQDSNPYISLPIVDGSIYQRIATAWISYGDGVTIETLINNSGNGPTSRWICGTGGGGAGSIGVGGCSLCGLGIKNYRTGYDFSPGYWNLQTVTVSRSGYKYYINGNLIDSQSTSTFTPNEKYGKYMSFSNGKEFRFRNWRYYLRMITAEEIAHNYAIEKARFNLS